MSNEPLNPKEAYIAKCAEGMQLRYGRKIKIRITQVGTPKFYPRGAWFDQLIGQILEPAGVDLDSIPKHYVMPNGDGVPFYCAEVLESGIKLGDYYIQFRWQEPSYVRPEAGDNMWQLSLGFLVITRMK